MSAAQASARLSLRSLVWGGLLLALAALLLAPYAFLLLVPPAPAVLLGALAGYLLRRNVVDALVLAVPILLAEEIERGFGAAAFACLALPLFVLTRRPRFSTVVSSLLLGLLLLAIHFKERFAGTILTWQDVQFFFLQFADNVGVMASQPTLLLYAGLAFAAAGAVGWAGWWLDRKVQVRSRRLAWCSALAALVAVGWSARSVVHDVETLRARGAWSVGFTQAPLYAPLSRFLATVAMRPGWMPTPVDTTAFARAVHQRAAAAAGASTPADIALFLQESQFNPESFQDCPPALCRLPVFEEPAATAQGPLRVHVFGGGTWLSEFAVNTGVPHDTFGQAGGFAPFNVAPGVRRSFVRSLRDAGYRTVAVYPVRGGMMNARIAYHGYGFDKFYDAADLGLSAAFATPDAQVHAAARKVLAEERRQGKPVFMMVVTIFNHGEHGVLMDRVPPEYVRQAHQAFSVGKEADNVADYVWRTTEFQRELAVTASAVLDAGRPAVLGWFGDHQPAFGNALGLRDRIQPLPAATGRFPAKFQTWYQVRTNRGDMAQPVQSLDLVFLPGVLAQAAGVRLDDWLAANVTAREQCGGLLDECRRAEVRDAYLSYLWHDLRAFDLP